MTESIQQYLLQGRQAGAPYRLAGPRQAPQGSAGAQLGRLAGESMEFMDHREYQPGDDLRRLDWSAYARTDKMIVKLYRQEVCPHLDLVIDGSRSMSLEGSDKLRGAVAMAAAVVTAAENAGYSHRVYLAAAHGCQPLINGDREPRSWQGLAFEGADDPAQALRKAPPPWKPRGIRMVISDLLWMGDPLELLTALADRAAAAYVVQVLAAADVDPAPRGHIRLIDSESRLSQDVFVDAVALARYRNRLQSHRESWHRAARQVGAVFVPMVAETFCSGWDFSPLVETEILTV